MEISEINRLERTVYEIRYVQTVLMTLSDKLSIRVTQRRTLKSRLRDYLKIKGVNSEDHRASLQLFKKTFKTLVNVNINVY